MVHDTITPRLVVTSDGVLHGAVLDIAADNVLLGRNANCDLVLDDPHVSRTHARLYRAGQETLIADLGSSSGTRVNGTPITRPFVLAAGDVVEVGGVTLLYQAAGGDDSTRLLPAQRSAPDGQPTSPVGPRYDIGTQQGGIISNVGGNQYNQYVQERDSFLREVAATKTKARFLILLGFFLYVLGLVVFAAPIMHMFGVVTSGTTTEQDFTDAFGKQILGVPLGLWGWATAGVGTLLIVVGIVLHVVASARRRRGEADIARRWQV